MGYQQKRVTEKLVPNTFTRQIAYYEAKKRIWNNSIKLFQDDAQIKFLFWHFKIRGVHLRSSRIQIWARKVLLWQIRKCLGNSLRSWDQNLIFLH